MLDAERFLEPGRQAKPAVQYQPLEVGGQVDMPPRTVLLVDDDADMRLYLRSCLRVVASPFDRVIEAADGLEALRLIRSEAVDVVISDVGLPRLDGRRLSRAIRDDAALRHIAVLLISGDGVLGDSAADGFLFKPFNSHQLLAALDGLVPRGPAPPEL
ncbi:MAG: two-component system sensor histidine kinase/response regulator [Geminicoccaceae bacterium]|jgi:CheY-like chemotaxis protein|nr:two-component system sensor histidine kinase/response regulator [Geminicoccaceae bacterium]